jgi:hypothetical protein
MVPNTNTNTGKKDSKGRIIYKGPRGGEFVRGAEGKKLPPAGGGGSKKVTDSKKVTGKINFPALPGDVQKLIMGKMQANNLARLSVSGKSTKNAAQVASSKHKENVEKREAAARGIIEAVELAITNKSEQKLTVGPYAISVSKPDRPKKTGISLRYFVTVECPDKLKLLFDTELGAGFASGLRDVVYHGKTMHIYKLEKLPKNARDDISAFGTAVREAARLGRQL